MRCSRRLDASVFHFDHAIDPFGERCPGHDSRCCAGSYRPRGNHAGNDVLDDSQAGLGGGDVGRADGETVHQRLVEGGRVDVGDDGFSRNESEGIGEFDDDWRSRLGLFQDRVESLGHGQHPSTCRRKKFRNRSMPPSVRKLSG